jgi:hypothetical protein
MTAKYTCLDVENTVESNPQAANGFIAEQEICKRAVTNAETPAIKLEPESPL